MATVHKVSRLSKPGHLSGTMLAVYKKLTHTANSCNKNIAVLHKLENKYVIEFPHRKHSNIFTFCVFKSFSAKQNNKNR